MQISRKQAIMAGLFAIFGPSTKVLVGQKETSAIGELVLSNPSGLNTSFVIEEKIISPPVNGERRYMLEVRADGRVARFTSQEVMDALGGMVE